MSFELNEEAEQPLERDAYHWAICRNAKEVLDSGDV